MARTSDKPAGPPKADRTGALSGSLPGLLAEENEFDRKSLLRIGTWGVLALGAVALAVVSNQSALGLHREQIAAGDLARQAQQIRELTKESQNETKRLASAIDTLNNDRDRLYSRVTVLEQGLDSVTGAIAKQNTPPQAPAAQASVPAAEPSPAPSPTANLGAIPQAKAQPVPPIQQGASVPSQAPPPAVGPVASAPPPPAPVPPAPEKLRADMAAKPELTPPAAPSPSPAQFASNASALAATSSPPLIAPKSMMGPPDPAAPKMIEAPKPVAAPASSATPPTAQTPAVATATPVKDQDTPQASEVTVQHTEFAVDLGSASSVAGLRALWRGLVKTDADLAELRPIIVVKESTTGFGMQLRLAAGPLHDAAAAAKICAALMENKRACETTVFDGQRLAMGTNDAQGSGEKPAAEVKPGTNSYRHIYYSKRGKKDDAPAKPESSSFSSLLGIGGKK